MNTDIKIIFEGLTDSHLKERKFSPTIKFDNDGEVSFFLNTVWIATLAPRSTYFMVSHNEYENEKLIKKDYRFTSTDLAFAVEKNFPPILDNIASNIRSFQKLNDL